jgi:hypothetical protein
VNTRKTMLWAIVLCVVISVLMAGIGRAQGFSQVLSFQGRLCSTDGKPLPDGPYVVQFTIYDAQSGGNALWQETQGVTQVGGVFTVYLGSVTGFPVALFKDGDRWLGIKVGGDPEMAQRFRFTPAPWAIQAKNADTVDSIHASATPTPNYLLPLDATGKFPASVLPSSSGWSLTGNAGTNPATDFLGTTDNKTLIVRTNNTEALRVLANGNIGMGTDLPSSKLEVVAPSGTALFARSLAASGPAFGVYGVSESTTGTGVYGVSQATSGQAYGVWGQNTSPSGYGGYFASAGIGLMATSSGAGPALKAECPSGDGIEGWTNQAGKSGVYGHSTIGCGVHGSAADEAGVFGQSTAGPGVYGVSGSGSGGEFTSPGIGLVATSSGAGPALKAECPSGDGIEGWTNQLDKSGVFGHSDVGYGVTGMGDGKAGVVGRSASGPGIYGVSGSGYAGLFDGDILATGPGRYAQNGDTASLYLGDGNSYARAVRGYGLRFGVWQVPDALAIQESTGNVGIGTTAPTHRLTVSGSNSALRLIGTGAYGSMGTLNFGDGDYVSIREDSDDNLLIQTTNGRMALMGGNVGIGTFGPQGKLHVAANAGTSLLVESSEITAAYPAIDASRTTEGYTVRGRNLSTGGIGVLGPGNVPTPSGGTFVPGVYGEGDVVGVYGRSTNGNGVVGYGMYSGLMGIVYGSGTGTYKGVSGEASGANGTNRGVQGTGLYGDYACGVYGYGYGGSSTSYGVYGSVGEWSRGYAGYFSGHVRVLGYLYKDGGGFRIDHPLDPTNKYLTHSFVESPDMKNVYDGVVVLDGAGEAWIELPEWFGVLNRDFRYQLTAIGAPGPNLYIAREIADNAFMIAGGTPGMKVSWQVTGIRQDPYAEAHRILVEEMKPPHERGLYDHPEVYGRPASEGVTYRHEQEVLTQSAQR